MTLPDAVIKAQQTVKEIHESVTGKAGDPAAGTPDPQTPPPGEPINPMPEATHLDRVQPIADPLAPGAEPGPMKDFEQEYNTLRGKYDAEVPRLTSQLKDLESKVQSTLITVESQKMLIDELSKREPAAAAAQPAGGDPAVQPHSKIDVSTLEGYDPVVIDIVNRLNDVIANNDKLTEDNASLKAEIGKANTTANNASSAASKSVADIFWADVQRGAPNFHAYNGNDGQNADPQWANFLNSYNDKMEQYRALAARSIETGDSQLLVDVVTAFEAAKGSNGGGSTPPAPGGKTPPLSPRKGGGGTPIGQAPEIVTDADMKNAQVMLTAGKIDNKEFRVILAKYQKSNLGT